MSLYRWELQKIWKRRSARVALALMLVWTMVGILVNAFYNNSHKEDGVTPCVPGPQEITNQLAWAEPWRGELTGAQLAAAQTIVYDLYRDPANLGPDGEVTNEAWNAVVRPMGSMTNTLMNIAAGVYGLPYAAWGGAGTRPAADLLRGPFRRRGPLAAKPVRRPGGPGRV